MYAEKSRDRKSSLRSLPLCILYYIIYNIIYYIIHILYVCREEPRQEVVVEVPAVCMYFITYILFHILLCAYRTGIICYRTWCPGMQKAAATGDRRCRLS